MTTNCRPRLIPTEKCTLWLDFALVQWRPRLAEFTEAQRLRLVAGWVTTREDWPL